MILNKKTILNFIISNIKFNMNDNKSFDELIDSFFPYHLYDGNFKYKIPSNFEDIKGLKGLNFLVCNKICSTLIRNKNIRSISIEYTNSIELEYMYILCDDNRAYKFFLEEDYDEYYKVYVYYNEYSYYPFESDQIEGIIQIINNIVDKKLIVKSKFYNILSNRNFHNDYCNPYSFYINRSFLYSNSHTSDDIINNKYIQYKDYKENDIYDKVLTNEYLIRF